MSNTNPHVLTWTNPTLNTDGTAYDAANNNIGYTIEIDGAGAISVPLAYGTSFDMGTLAAYQALKSGSHNVALAVVTSGGTESAFSAPATFLIIGTPMVPTNLAVV